MTTTLSWISELMEKKVLQVPCREYKYLSISVIKYDILWFIICTYKAAHGLTIRFYIVEEASTLKLSSSKSLSHMMHQVK